MSPSQGHDTIAWYIIKIQLGSDNLWPGHGLGYVCTVTMTLEIWSWVKVMTHPWVMDNNCVKYYPDPTWQWGVMAWKQISSMCALWPWPWRYDLGSMSWHILRLQTINVWNIIQIQLGSEELWPGYGFPLYVHCDLDLGDMTLGQCRDTPLGHAQHLCEILSRSNLAVRSYGPDTDFQYVCTVTMTLEIWSWVRVMTHPWVMDNNCVKYYPDPTWQWGVMAWKQISSMCALWPWPWRYDLGSKSWHTLWSLKHQLCEIISRSDKGVRSYGLGTMWTDGQTDRQTDRQGDSYIPPKTLYARGITNTFEKSDSKAANCYHLSFWLVFNQNDIVYEEKQKEIWLSPMMKAPIPTENSTTNWQHKNATKNFDYTTIADRLGTVKGYPTFPLTTTAM